jgi:hypothetical protein
MAAPKVTLASHAGVADSSDPNANSTAAAEDPAFARFTTTASWEIAGYNDEEIVYTILIHSLDSRILRCTTSLQGSYIENGQKQTTTDRQLVTVFPDQEIKAGNWMGMDPQSSVAYVIRCRPL